jgi:hypothetical protein
MIGVIKSHLRKARQLEKGHQSENSEQISYKVVKDAFKHARFQSIAYYHRNVLKQPMNSRQAKASNLYLQKDEYLQGDID